MRKLQMDIEPQNNELKIETKSNRKHQMLLLPTEKIVWKYMQRI